MLIHVLYPTTSDFRMCFLAVNQVVNIEGFVQSTVVILTLFKWTGSIRRLGVFAIHRHVTPPLFVHIHSHGEQQRAGWHA